MSHRLIARSNDLLALRNAGLHLEVRNGYLLIKDVPYVNASREVREDGVLVLGNSVLSGHEAIRTWGRQLEAARTYECIRHVAGNMRFVVVAEGEAVGLGGVSSFWMTGGSSFFGSSCACPAT